MRNSKKRPAKEIYEDYCSLTLEYTNFKGQKFLNLLKTVVEDIDSRNKNDISSEEYDLLQNKVLDINPKNAKDGKISTRKSINSLVKLGFVSSKLNNYHRLSKEYLISPTDKYREKLFSAIVVESANFAADVSSHDGRWHVDFITSTLMRIGSLNKKQIIGLMTIDPLEYKAGFIDLDELNLASESASEDNFFERKYNQVSFVCNVLNKLEDFTFHNNKLWFDDDVKKRFQKELDNKLIDRNRYLDEKAKAILENENFQITGNKMTCMVNNIVYPTLISSHIKRSEKCDRNEKYDHKNLILVCDEIDGPFDKGDISFDDQGNILFANNLSAEFKEKFKGMSLNQAFIDEHRLNYLKWNRENWFNKQNRHR